jgi:hypothetical protein
MDITMISPTAKKMVVRLGLPITAKKKKKEREREKCISPSV